MAGEAETESASALDEYRIDATVQGVFEGGGAKGVLFAGALKAMVERNLWFSAVAGSSAGAITAALIAAGMGPADIKNAMPGGLKVMAPPKAWRGLWRVRKGTGFLDREQVRIWLRDQLRNRVHTGASPTEEPDRGTPEKLPERRLSVYERVRLWFRRLFLERRREVARQDEEADRGPTFEQLHDPRLGGSGIDLYVVAVDLSGRHVMVFNHALTPDCPVADAVTASATIPVAFEPLIFQVPRTNAEGPSVSWRFVADGGLASNFPDFVFQDAGFREYAGLPPRPEGKRIVGFLLDEGPDMHDDLLDLYRQGSFLGDWSALQIELERLAKEVANTTGDGSQPEETPSEAAPPAPSSKLPPPQDPCPPHRTWIGSVVWSVERAIQLPIGFLAAASRGRDWQWNWPEPKNRHVGLWARTMRQWFTAAPLQAIGGVAIFAAMYWVGFLAVAPSLMPDFSPDRLGDAWSIAIGVLVGGAMVAIATWVWLLGIGAFLFMFVSYRTVGLIGHPLLRALLQAPAAPPWAGCRPGETVIRLRVPTGMTTLGLSQCVNLEDEIDAARVSTLGQLERMLHPSPADDD